MHLRHLQVHRRADGLFGFGNIAHEIDVSSDGSKRHVQKRQPQEVRTVFKTMEATFEGKIGGYKTVGHEPKPTGSSNDDDETDSKKEAEEKKKEQAEEKKKEAEEAKEKAKEQAEKEEEAAKKKAAEDKAKQEKAEEEKKKAEEAAKKKAAEDAKSRSKSEDDNAKESSTAKPTRTRAQITTSNDPSSVPSVLSDPTGSQSIESILAKATGSASASTTIDEVADMSGASSLPSSSSSATPEASGGTSAGTKAGIAFGVLGGLLAMGLLVYFIFTKRRKQAEMERLENDDEKLHGPMAGNGGPPMVAAAAVRRSMSPEPIETASIRTDAKAPRVSLRPVTQFLPNWNGLEKEKRASKGAGLTLAVPAAASSPATGPLSPRTVGGSAWERPSTAQSVDPANPFGTQAERVPSPVQEETASALRASPSPMSEKSTMAVAAATAPVSPQSPSSPQGPPTANGPAVAAIVARKTSIRKAGGPQQLDLTLPNAPMAAVPASPAGTEYSSSSAPSGGPDSPSAGAAAIAAAGGPANSAVHRVQLDFKPTMDDELELRAGDLVRLLHEYDDGWALCIRLDRSRQGVVPRTCLSTRPVKPRPAQGGPRPGPPVKAGGPARGPGPNQPQGQRPMTPQGNFGQARPASPAGPNPNGSRPQSPMGPPGRPQGRPMSPGPRAQSPGPRNGPPSGGPMSPGPRSQSPGPAGGRSQSPSGMNRRHNPPGPSPMNPSQDPRSGPSSSGSLSRKPVPGQAY
ncbi:hypothetical protein FOVG_04587 [Fusarium oxysporum f. sp. pisi HDV247]|uniref:SH3 domain-containing protein n=1 Tax=Fusarium oxysporum f. sp. pisi HDV247 TaxID=1080344 RepID=W9Q6U4_FUSOX|nr:hypothetical protein FOVG_04587 [Fusarium oxysporum f. sp. pisi HDV247]